MQDPDDITVLPLCGEIDGKTAPALEQDLTARMTGKKNVVLDFTKVTYLSSAGLRLLLGLTRFMTQQNGKLVLVGVIEPIRDVMDQTGFLSHFTLADNLDQAKTTLAGSP